MKQPQTAVPGAADNTVVLNFQQALWSHRIMQSLPHDKDAEPWGSYTDLLFPRQNKCHTSLTLQIRHEEHEPGSKQLVHSWNLQLHHILSLCRRQPHRHEHVSNLGHLSVARCTHTQTNMRLHKYCQCEKLDSLSLLPLCLCALRYFPLSQFYELLRCSQKRKRQRPEDENQ